MDIKKEEDIYLDQIKKYSGSENIFVKAGLIEQEETRKCEIFFY